MMLSSYFCLACDKNNNDDDNNHTNNNDDDDDNNNDNNNDNEDTPIVIVVTHVTSLCGGSPHAGVLTVCFHRWMTIRAQQSKGSTRPRRTHAKHMAVSHVFYCLRL